MCLDNTACGFIDTWSTTAGGLLYVGLVLAHKALPLLCALHVWVDLDLQQCSNCFGGLPKSRPLDNSKKLAKDNKELTEGDGGGATPLNKPLEASSPNEMENNGNTSRQPRNLASISASNHVQETHSPADSDANSSGYVNHALSLWTERRREWAGSRERPRPQQPREPVISWSTTYEDLLATNRPFPQPIPLPEMVDFLVDVWEQEGLYE